jgi:restriction system protein
MLAHMSSTELPQYRELLWPVIQAIIELGGSASNTELDAAVTRRESIPPELQTAISSDGRRTEVQYRLAWARTYLNRLGLLTNSKRGVWAITDLGQTVKADQVREMFNQLRAQRLNPSENATTNAEEMDLNIDFVEAQAEADWKAALLKRLGEMSPSAFERLSKWLLREAGFSSVVVTGRTNDGGIDGMGVYHLSLLSFPIFFQCKRYAGSVGSPMVRDFRGAMAGRGDKGLLITTGTFSGPAVEEANRDGAQPIDLIDGEQLCDLLKEYSLGVATQLRTVEEVTIDGDFFTSLEIS